MQHIVATGSAPRLLASARHVGSARPPVKGKRRKQQTGSLGTEYSALAASSTGWFVCVLVAGCACKSVGRSAPLRRTLRTFKGRALAVTHFRLQNFVTTKESTAQELHQRLYGHTGLA
jgi:hypothetical protein